VSRLSVLLSACLFLGPGLAILRMPKACAPMMPMQRHVALH
jgi:hypothetical protein